MRAATRLIAMKASEIHLSLSFFIYSFFILRNSSATITMSRLEFGEKNSSCFPVSLVKRMPMRVMGLSVTGWKIRVGGSYSRRCRFRFGFVRAGTQCKSCPVLPPRTFDLMMSHSTSTTGAFICIGPSFPLGGAPSKNQLPI